MTTTHTATTLTLFGAWRCEREGKLIHLSRSKVKALLAYLVLYPQPHTREALATLFWGDYTDTRARTSLRTAVAILRRELGDDILEADREMVQLNPQFPLDTDTRRFNNFLKQLENDSVIPPVAEWQLFAADLLAEFYDDWVLRERENFRLKYLDALLACTQKLRTASEYVAALDYVQLILARDPANERAYQHAMFCHMALGNRAAALNAYARCTAALREELAIEPSDETRALHDWLKQPATAPTLAAKITNLPIPQTNFIGRIRETTALKKLVREQTHHTRLVTLHGAGGSGKTRLAIQVATDLIDLFRDGVWWVELAALSDQTLVPQAIAKALGVRQETTEPLSELLAHFIGAKEMLLVLDNCEHVVNACAQLTQTLLQQCPRLQVMTTSRERLNVLGEIVWPVPPLTVPAQTASLSELLLTYEGVRLFVERARAVRADFALNDENALAIAQICRRLDGIPLALELAAARVSTLTPAQIAARLDDRFALLTQGSRAALPRQQTLRALIDWSYDLLPEDERALFCRLSVFAGGWTLESAEEICADETLPRERILETLALLVEKSLVISPNSEVARFTMLETIREYAQQHVSADERAAVQARQLNHFIALAEHAEPLLESRHQIEWLTKLELEHDNLRAALRWALEQDAANPESFASIQLAGALSRFWKIRGYQLEAAEWLYRALELAGERGPAQVRGRAYSGAGTMEWDRGNYVRAYEIHTHAYELYQQAGDDWGQAYALINRIVQNIELGLPDRIEHDLPLAFEYAHRSRDDNLLAMIYLNIGYAHHERGEYTKAETAWKQLLHIAEQHELEVWKAYAYHNLGDIALHRAEYATAMERYRESEMIGQRIGDVTMLMANLVFQGYVYYFIESFDEAREKLQRALQLAEQHGSRRQLIQALDGLVLLDVRAKNRERAAILNGASGALHTKHGVTMQPILREKYPAAQQQLEQEMGAVTYAQAVVRGGEMNLTQVIALALED